MAFHQQPARPSPQRVIPVERRDSLSSPAGGPQHQHHQQHPHPQHPQRQRLRRSSRTGDLLTPITTAALSTPTGDEDPEQTWVLFAPASDSHTTSYLSSISSPATPGRSQFSELGSPRPAARAASRSRYGRGGAESDADGDDGVLLDGGSLAGEDDTELDSLDGHLAEFRGHAGMYQQPAGSSYNLHQQQNQHQQHQHQQQQNRRHRRDSNYQTQPAQTPRLPHPHPQQQQHHQMPSHDGLGSFRIHQPATAPEVQEQIYAHERYNRRRLRRRDSVEQARREEEEALSREAEKMQRIEAWRLEQSTILLDEIQKLTRQRRRQSHTPQPQRRDSYRMRWLEEEEEGDDDVMAGHDMAVSAAPERTMSRRPPPSDRESVNWHDEEAAVGFSAEDEEDDPEDGFWTRITKRVIRELMGIDDRLLSILFGETLPDDEDLIITPRPPSPLSASGMREAFSSSSSSWQLHVLERVAKELGMLVNHLSHHPGAFSTYNRMQQMPIPYAGLPVIPESTTAGKPARRGSAAQHPEFRPSVSRGAAREGSYRGGEPYSRSRAAARSGSAGGGASAASATTATLFTQEEWEQDLDIKLVFRYLRSRFVDSSPPPSSSSSSSYSPSHFEPPVSPSLAPMHLASASLQDTAAKSARVRQNHPLIGGGAGAAGRPRAAYQAPSSSAPYPHQQWPRHAPGPAAPIAPAGIASTLTSTTNAVMAAASATVARVRRAASCATLGSMRSVATTGATKQSGCSSRNYWDFGGGAGGSVGTGSVVASASAGGPMGSWGEV